MVSLVWVIGYTSVCTIFRRLRGNLIYAYNIVKHMIYYFEFISDLEFKKKLSIIYNLWFESTVETRLLACPFVSSDCHFGLCRAGKKSQNAVCTFSLGFGKATAKSNHTGKCNSFKISQCHGFCR